MTNTFQFEINANNIARLIFDLPNEKVNTISPEVLDALEEQLDTLAKNRAIRALMITSAKKDSFIAGANLKGFDAVFHQKGAAEKLIGGGHRVFNKLSSLPFPTIAVIDGTCLGGGLELALACNYRVVSDNSKALLGLPETQLGIIPGWGGTQRLPRLIGIEQALGMILSGKPVNAQKAFKIKIVDAIFPKEFINEKAEDFAEYCLASENQKAIAKKREQTGWRSTLMEGNFIGRYLLFSMARRNVLALTKGHYPAPLVALDLIKRTYTKPLAQGLKEEICTFIAAIPNEFRNAPNLIHVFFASEEVKKNPDLPPGAHAKKVESAAVIGAGTMGAGIVWLFTNSDIPVRFKDVSWAAIGKGYGVIRQIYHKMLKSRKLRSEEMSRKFLLASGTIDYTGFSHVDLVIEAAAENLELKKRVFAELEEEIPKDAILATNTSSLTIDSMASSMKHPERFVGMHFFNPPNKMPLVEVVAGKQTSPNTLATAVELCKRMKKVPIIVKDCPGFLVNRIFAIAANEAGWMLQEGVTMERLERLITRFGMPMGPFTLSDEVGNDIAYKVFSGFHSAYGERFRMPKISKEVFDEHFFGKKSGTGYFLYKGKKAEENPEIKKLLQKNSFPKRDVSDQDVVERFVFGMINEASRCLEEGVVKNATHLDIALIYGMGFPPFRGGLLRYADSIGSRAIVEKLNVFQKAYGERFTPSNLLVEMAATNRKFYGEQNANRLSSNTPELALK